MITLCSRLALLEGALCRSLLSCKLKINPESQYFVKNWSSQSVVDGIKIDNCATSVLTCPQVVSIVKSVQHFGFEERKVKTLLNCQPELSRCSANSWQSIIGTLLDGDFNEDQIFTILEKYPSILFWKRDNLIKKLMTWTNFGFGNDLVCELISTHPHLLNVNSNDALKRVKQYQIQFESKRRVGKLLLIAPNTLEDSWKVICDKLNYLNNLCVDNSEIVSSGVLAHSLFHIKARHEFLIRSGVYKKPQKDFHKKLSKNATLARIVNTTDEDFVSSVAGLSMFEYNVFLEMFEKELADSIEPGEIDYEDEVVMNKLSYKKRTNKF